VAARRDQHRDNAALTVGLSIFGAPENGVDISVISAATMMVIAPLLVLFLVFQRQFVQAFLRMPGSSKKLAGLLVESVSDMITVVESELQPVPEVMSPEERKLAKAIVARKDQIICFLDPEPMIGAREFGIPDELAA
jgi:chemotaxis signal transduction protein